MSSLSDWLGDFDFYYDLIDPLIENGWYAYLFPFLLVYAIVLTILTNVPMFRDHKPVRVIIALVFALFAIAFPISDGDCDTYYGGGFISSGCTLGDFMMVLFPGVTAFTIGILALYIVAAMMGLNLMEFFGNNDKDNWVKYILGGLGVLVVVYYYAKGFGWDGFEGSWLEDFFTDPLLYILIVFGLVFWMITKEEPSAHEKYRKKIDKMTKKGMSYDEARSRLGPPPSEE